MASTVLITELSRVIQIFGDKSSKSLFELNQKKSRLRQLARKFSNSGPKNESEWAYEICKTSVHDHKYVQLRSKLKRRLIGQLFHLDLGADPEIRKAFYLNAREIFGIRVLLTLGARVVAIWLIPRALERSRTFELTQDRIELLQILKQHATINGDRKKFALFTHEIEYTRSLRQAEIRLQDLSDEINVELATTANPNEKTQLLSKRSFEEATKLFKLYPTFNIGLLYYRLGTLASETAQDYFQTFVLCDEAEIFLTQYSRLAAPVHRGQFAIKRLTSALSTRNLQGFSSAMKSCEAAFPETYNNWFIWKEMEFVFYMHSQEWKQAMELQRFMISHNRFGSQPESVRQKWMLYGIYSSFAAAREGVGVSPPRTIAKLLQDVPIYQRDKAGYNAALYILQYLILAWHGKLNELAKLCEGIRKYVERTLRGQHHKQLYGFLRTLLILDNYDYNLEITNIRAKKYIEQFRRYGYEKVTESQTLPYDLMWEWIQQWIALALKDRRGRDTN